MRPTLLVLPPLLAIFLVVGGFLATLSGADDVVRQPLVDARTMKAVEAGLEFLARTQSRDGSWKSNAGKKINEGYSVFENGLNVGHVGVTSLGILAYLAGGHVPGRGPYGAVLDRAVDYVLGQVQPSSGYISSNRTRMYSHAFATLALAEVYGITRKEKVKERLEHAVQFTVKCQNGTGGWRYVPFTTDSDMSVTVCQVVALRAARNIGIKVPRATIDRALHYVISSANTLPRRRGGQWPVGSFLYQPQTQQFNRDSFALTAAGLTTIFQAGLYDNESIQRYVRSSGMEKDPPPDVTEIVDYMWRTYRLMRQGHKSHYFFWYGQYYATQAMYQYGSQKGRRAIWQDWYRRVRDDILGRQSREGWWRSNVDTTHAYATASALLILQFPLDQLPIHQR